jgi:hypothetical protein
MSRGWGFFGALPPEWTVVLKKTAFLLENTLFRTDRRSNLLLSGRVFPTWRLHAGKGGRIGIVAIFILARWSI